MPDSNAEQEEGFRRVWQNLRQVATVEDGRHDTPHWQSHTGKFALCGVRVPASAFTTDLQDVREALRSLPFVRLHPDHFLHIAIQELGFVSDAPMHRDELARDRLDEFIAMAGRPISDFGPFEVTLGGVNSFTDAAFLDVHDDGWLSRIHRRLRDFAILPVDPRYPYLPTLTIAHYVESAPIGRLPAILSEWRDSRFGSFTADSVDILLLDTAEPYPELEVAHSFALGNGRNPAEAALRPA
ncbi:MAG TPA: 2'-5' RNA ligase family protein [Thermomicrobiales bacterium]|nr:2'-5' RNA ligase family protein [Thermomicrobiales bacterium]